MDKVLITGVERDVCVIPSTFTGMPFARISGTHTSAAQVVPNPISESTVMKHKRYFEIDRTEAREAATIGAMIADMRRVVEVLDSSVSAEEVPRPNRQPLSDLGQAVRGEARQPKSDDRHARSPVVTR